MSAVFDGVIMTDDIAMGAVADMENVYVKAVNAGNDLLITTDYQTGYNQILDAVKCGEISEETLNSAVERVLKNERANIKQKAVEIEQPFIMSVIYQPLIDFRNRPQALALHNRNLELYRNAFLSINRMIFCFNTLCRNRHLKCMCKRYCAQNNGL